MLHVDQVRTALVSLGEGVVVGDECVDLLLLISETLGHHTRLRLRRLELGLVPHDHLEEDGVRSSRARGAHGWLHLGVTWQIEE